MLSRLFLNKLLILVPALIFSLASIVHAAKPAVFFSDLSDGPIVGWEGSSTKGAAVSIWGLNFGTSRGASYVTCGGVKLTNDSDYAEWGVVNTAGTKDPAAEGVYVSARSLERITFYLNSKMQTGPGTISVTTPDGTSELIPFYFRNTGNIYFMSRSGSDNNNGLFATEQGGGNGPWFSVAKLKSTLQAGDVCYFRAGVWDEIDSWDTALDFYPAGGYNNGKANNSITIASYPGEFAQIGNYIMKYAIGRHGSSAPHVSYWTISKFILRASANVVRWSTGSCDNMRWIGNDGSTDGKTIFPFFAENGMVNMSFYGNNAHDAGVSRRGDSAYPSKGYSFSLSGGGIHDNVDIGWNEFSYNTYGHAYYMYGHEAGDQARNIKFHDNYMHHNGLSNGVVGGGDRGPYTFVKNLEFYNNIHHNPNTRGSHPDFVINPGIESDPSYLKFYNNIWYSGDNPLGILQIKSETGSLEFKNNVFYSSTEFVLVGDSNTNVIGENNIYYGGATDIPSWEKNPLKKDPLFTNPAKYDFTLQAGSPAIDAGTASNVSATVLKDYNGLPRPLGSTPLFDIGAHEYLVSAPKLPAPIIKSIVVQ